MFGIQDSALHPMRCSVTTLKEEPLGSAAAAAAAATAHNLHQVSLTLTRKTRLPKWPILLQITSAMIELF